MTLNERVLALNMSTLTVAEIEWLHTLKNKAAAMQGRLQLKHLKEEIDQQQKGA